MDMDFLIKEGVRNLKKEAKIIDRMLTFIEDKQVSKFVAYVDYYKKIKVETDDIISSILDNYKVEDIISYIINNLKSDKDELLALLTFAGLSDCEYVNRVGRELFDKNMDSFAEEHNKVLLSVYLWGIDNEEMSEKEKKELHQFMVLQLTSSQFIRQYFSGEYELAEKTSNPDNSFGEFAANEMALNTYYSLLNKLINDCNTFEMFEGMESKESFNARKKLLKYQLVALCSQIEKRKIEYPCVQVPISDFTTNILESSSLFNEAYKNRKILEKKPNVIYL